MEAFKFLHCLAASRIKQKHVFEISLHFDLSCVIAWINESRRNSRSQPLFQEKFV